MIIPPSAPLCESRAILPRSGIIVNVPLKSRLFDTPTQFGPIIRIPARLAASASSFSILTPSGPISLKPPEITTAWRAPAFLTSAINPGQYFAATAIITKSTGTGKSERLG